jgi:hypothetical protein
MRRLRPALAAALFVAAALAAGLAAVPAAHAAVWTIGAGDKAFPSSPVGGSQSIALSAAGNEYQAAQVAARAPSRSLGAPARRRS